MSIPSRDLVFWVVMNYIRKTKPVWQVVESTWLNDDDEDTENHIDTVAVL
jgi:hypothetical protein